MRSRRTRGSRRTRRTRGSRRTWRSINVRAGLIRELLRFQKEILEHIFE